MGHFVHSRLAKVTRMHALGSFKCLSTWVARLCAQLMLYTPRTLISLACNIHYRSLVGEGLASLKVPGVETKCTLSRYHSIQTVLFLCLLGFCLKKV